MTIFEMVKTIIGGSQTVPNAMAQAKTYSSFAEALSASGPGYADDDLAHMVLEKTLIARKNMPDFDSSNVGICTGLLYTALRFPHRPLRILDIGGAFGIHGRMCRAKFSQLPQRWAVVESPAFAASAAAAEDESLHIFSTMNSAVDWLGGVDLLYSSSAVQYFPDPVGLLRDAVAVRAPIQLWQRFPIAKQREAIVLQVSHLADNGVGPLPPGFVDREISYPCTYLTESSFLHEFSTHYRTVLRVPGTEITSDGLATSGWLFLFEVA